MRRRHVWLSVTGVLVLLAIGAWALPLQVGDAHANAAGYRQIGASVYAWLCAGR